MQRLGVLLFVVGIALFAVATVLAFLLPYGVWLKLIMLGGLLSSIAAAVCFALDGLGGDGRPRAPKKPKEKKAKPAKKKKKGAEEEASEAPPAEELPSDGDPFSSGTPHDDLAFGEPLQDLGGLEEIK
jgi:hypothetical protein